MIWEIRKRLNEVVPQSFVSMFKDEGVDVHVTIVNVENMDARIGGIFAEARIVPLNALDYGEMMTCCNLVARMCHDDNEMPTFDIMGKTFRIGDGDDSFAARFDAGAIFVWVRHLPDLE